MLKLTEREIECAELLACGRSNREIGRVLGIAERTVKEKLGHLYMKTGMASDIKGARLKLAMNWRCELYQIGLKELGMI